MKLPVIFPTLKAQCYDCEQCGKGCRELVVHLTERDRSRIDRQKWETRLPQAPYVRLGRGVVLNHKAGGECVFLRADGLCAIHAEFGFAEKPLACQLYPFTLEQEGAGLRVSVRFDCPAIAKSVGGPLVKHREDVVRIAGELKAAAARELASPTRPVELAAGRALSEAELDGLVQRLDGWLRDMNRPILDRLVGLDSFIGTLAGARLADVRGTRFADLVGVLVDDLPNSVRSSGATPVAPPSDRQLRLFRQAVFALCENVRLEEARAPLFQRLSNRMGQLERARRLVAGRGSIPALVRGLGDGTFEQLERITPHPDLSLHACDDLLTRYLRARITGRTAFGPGCHDRSVVEGLRDLLLAIAVTGWLTRYVALGSGRASFVYDDVVSAIGIMDRNATRSPELGRRPARLRLQYLAQNQGLLRLLRRYPMKSQKVKKSK